MTRSRANGGQTIPSPESSQVKGLIDDALSSEISREDVHKHLFRATKATTLAFHQSCMMLALLAVVGLVRLYFTLRQSGSGGDATGGGANSTSPVVTVGMADAAFAVGSCGCNLLFALVAPPLFWFADADFGKEDVVLATSSVVASLLGLLVFALALAFSYR